MKILLIGAMLLTASSCSFKSEDEGKPSSPKQIEAHSEEEVKPDPFRDSDGDKVTDIEEMKMGRDPFIANIPELRTRFLQNYKIEVKFFDKTEKREGQFVIENKRRIGDVGHRYRVGDLLIRKKAIENAAKFGRFSSHSTAEIKASDLSWVSYPELDDYKRLENQEKYLKYFDEVKYEIKDIKVRLTNEARLSEFKTFKSIKNLKTNYYYYDVEKEAIQLLKTQVEERHFQAGINEKFQVVLKDVPVTLVRDNFLRFGRFIFSEVEDYDIPEMEMKNTALVASVKASSIPLVLNTPNKTETIYIGANGKTLRFSEILSRAFGSKAKLENNEIAEINEFKSNLPEFSYLREVRGEDKKGKWFVFTNPIPRSHLDHKFEASDYLTLSFVRGSELARQSKRKSSFLSPTIKIEADDMVVPYGEVGRDSRVLVDLIPEKRWGETLSTSNESMRSPGGRCGGNRICPEYSCTWSVARFNTYNERMTFKSDFSKELDRLFFYFGHYEFRAKDLINEGVLKVREHNGTLRLEIKDLYKILDLTEEESVVLAFGIKSLERESFNGIRLDSFSGAQGNNCILLTGQYAQNNKLPISVDSQYFSRWQQYVDWNIYKKGETKTYGEYFSFRINALTTTFYN